jgi:DNA-binding protein HU-beta
MAGLYPHLKCWQSPAPTIIDRLVFRLLKRFPQSHPNFPIVMAAKKTTKKTAEPAPAKPEPAPVAKKAVKAAKKAPAKKAVAKKAVEPESAPAPAPTPASPATPVAKKVATKPSLDVIARAAYLNYRRRVEQGLPGDSHGDWLEAERQFSERP